MKLAQSNRFLKAGSTRNASYIEVSSIWEFSGLCGGDRYFPNFAENLVCLIAFTELDRLTGSIDQRLFLTIDEDR